MKNTVIDLTKTTFHSLFHVLKHPYVLFKYNN